MPLYRLALLLIALSSAANAFANLPHDPLKSILSLESTKEIDRTILNFVDFKFPQGINSRVDPLSWNFKNIQGPNSILIFEESYDSSLTVRGFARILENELKAAGANIHISCAGIDSECGYYFPQKTVRGSERSRGFRALNGLKGFHTSDHYMISSTLMLSGDEYYVSLYFIDTESNTVRFALDVTRQESQPNTDNIIANTQTNSIKNQIEHSGVAVLDGIYFDVNKSTITNESKSTLQAISDYLKQSPENKFEIAGHTDATGSSEYNLNLSLARAKAVMKALTSEYSVDSSQLSYEAYGESKPASSNTTREGRQKNRRVELILRTTALSAADGITKELSGAN